MLATIEPSVGSPKRTVCFHLIPPLFGRYSGVCDISVAPHWLKLNELFLGGSPRLKDKGATRGNPGYQEQEAAQDGSGA